MERSRATATEAKLHEVLRQNQPGRLAEAEDLYRRVLATRPDWADVHVNLGAVLMVPGDFKAAAVSCQQGVALQPNHARGHCYFGDIQSAQNRLDETVASYGRALALSPDCAEGYNSLGNALF